MNKKLITLFRNMIEVNTPKDKKKKLKLFLNKKLKKNLNKNYMGSNTAGERSFDSDDNLNDWYMNEWRELPQNIKDQVIEYFKEKEKDLEILKELNVFSNTLEEDLKDLKTNYNTNYNSDRYERYDRDDNTNNITDCQSLNKKDNYYDYLYNKKALDQKLMELRLKYKISGNFKADDTYLFFKSEKRIHQTFIRNVKDIVLRKEEKLLNEEKGKKKLIDEKEEKEEIKLIDEKEEKEEMKLIDGEKILIESSLTENNLFNEDIGRSHKISIRRAIDRLVYNDKDHILNMKIKNDRNIKNEKGSFSGTVIFYDNKFDFCCKMGIDIIKFEKFILNTLKEKFLNREIYFTCEDATFLAKSYLNFLNLEDYQHFYKKYQI